MLTCLRRRARGLDSPPFAVGVDLGQARDFTAIAVVEGCAPLRLRYLERVPLGTAYTEVVERLRRLSRSDVLAGRCRLFVDATGVGRGVLDLLRLPSPPCGLFPVVVTAGHRVSRVGGAFRIPKRSLILGLHALLVRSGLRISTGLQLAPALFAEMAALRIRLTPAGRVSFGTWRAAHDDLLFAVALACWGASLQDTPPGLSRAPGTPGISWS
jgi:hypothetical protein